MPNKGAYVIQLEKKDIGALFCDLLKLKANEDSPFEEEIKNYTQNNDEISADVKKLATDGIFKMAANIIAAPEYTVENRLGGGSIGYDLTRICGKPSISKNLVAINNLGSDSLIIQVYDDYKHYITWWIESFAGKNETTVPNFIPPKIKLEEFLLVLHSIDFFKRCSYEDQLNYITGDSSNRKVNEFLDTMRLSLKSRDIRWLLSAFLIITPNISEFKLDIDENDVVILTNKTFLVNTVDKKTNEDLIGFGEAGKTMGVEFYRSWLMAGGFEFKKAGEKGNKKIFIAPTALANHYVEIEANENGNAMVNHQTLIAEQMGIKLEELFEDISVLEESSATIADDIKVPTKNFCKSCGVELAEGVKFCKECGAKV